MRRSWSIGQSVKTDGEGERDGGGGGGVGGGLPHMNPPMKP